jgi:hypothetical protein
MRARLPKDLASIESHLLRKPLIIVTLAIAIPVVVTVSVYHLGVGAVKGMLGGILESVSEVYNSIFVLFRAVKKAWMGKSKSTT